MTLVGKTDIGLLRDSNQDSFGCKMLSSDAGFAVLCDGMGGHKGGKIAGQISAFATMNYIEEYCSDFGVPENIELLLREAVEKANSAVFAQSIKNEEYEGMGSTIVALFIKDGKASVCHVGDSRLYLLRDEEMIQKTKDHSIVQEMLDNGEISEAEIENHPLKNVITRAVGNPEKVEADYIEFEYNEDDLILLCSDGLSSYVEKAEIAETVFLYGATEECCQKLIDLANQSGGKDNITVVVFGKEE